MKHKTNVNDILRTSKTIIGVNTNIDTKIALDVFSNDDSAGGTLEITLIPESTEYGVHVMYENQAISAESFNSIVLTATGIDEINTLVKSLKNITAQIEAFIE